MGWVVGTVSIRTFSAYILEHAYKSPLRDNFESTINGSP